MKREIVRLQLIILPFVKSLDEIGRLETKRIARITAITTPQKKKSIQSLTAPEGDPIETQAKPTDEKGQFAFKGATQSPITSKKEETDSQSQVSKGTVADEKSTVSKVMEVEEPNFDSQKQGHSKLLPNTGSNPSLLAIITGMVFIMLAGFIKVFYKNDKF